MAGSSRGSSSGACRARQSTTDFRRLIWPPDSPAASLTIPASVLLEHWQGHRRVTRRVIEAFPDLPAFQIRHWWDAPLLGPRAGAGGDGLRDDAASRRGPWPAVGELLHHAGGTEPATKADLLRVWDATTEEMNTLWPTITTERFVETDTAFGSTRAASTTSCSIVSTTKCIIAARATCICGPSAWVHPPFRSIVER